MENKTRERKKKTQIHTNAPILREGESESEKSCMVFLVIHLTNIYIL